MSDSTAYTIEWVVDRMHTEWGKFTLELRGVPDVGWEWTVSEQSARFAGARTVLREDHCATLEEAMHQAIAYADERSRPSRVGSVPRHRTCPMGSSCSCGEN